MGTTELTIFFGWVTAVNIAIFIIMVLMIVLFRGTIAGIHSKLFSLNKEDLPLIYFQYLARYKFFILALNLAPYLALRIMAG